MGIKEKLVPIQHHLKDLINEVNLTVEAKMLRLPRQFRKEDDGMIQINTLLGLLFLIPSLYQVHRRKAIVFGLKDRELNPYGVAASVALAIGSTIFFFVSIHEVWVRPRFRKSTLEEIDDDLNQLFGYSRDHNQHH